ncbi:class I SAM-dependent methyltransferase [Actinobacillus porcinus]|uniref:class I SAM-dependent methyltransferase n=1 Tax=Actinobacillus porcinus TaxID=51048 RepID=UPI0023520965|nr:class I SAM-dependent methyltransferase [Actinobacillus porcinus]MCI5764357.1 class I SAM-dependent methyltransferase [Actinobacillus porcinus]MDY5421662.1 class I SAM-dependent methyltransferase [Actinobacillus porcinus]
MKKSVYDTENFFALYQKLRANPISLNNIVEKPTMLSLLPDLQGKRLLDLGCGTGEHLALYLEQGADFVVGVDLSESMLKQADINLSTKRPHFSLYQSSMEQLSELPENDFDIITSSFAFHYVQDFPKLLADIKAKLKPNGTLVFSQEHPIVTAYQGGERWEKNAQKEQIAYRLNFYRDEGERDRSWFKQPFKTYHRTTATIINQLIEAGFQIEKMAEPMLAEQPEWHAEFKDLQHRPVLLFLRARLFPK